MQRLREARFGIDPTYLSVSLDQTHPALLMAGTDARAPLWGVSATTGGVKEMQVGVEEE